MGGWGGLSERAVGGGRHALSCALRGYALSCALSDAGALSDTYTYIHTYIRIHTHIHT